MNLVFGDFDLKDFWYTGDYAQSEFIAEPVTDELVADIEAELGYKLPASYIELMSVLNGGVPNLSYCLTQHRTTWGPDHLTISGIYGITRSKRFSLGGELGSRYWIEKHGFPAIGIYFGFCPSSGHDMIALDYRECGPTGEPQVVHVENDDEFKIHWLADNFEQFIRGLRSDDDFD